MSDQETEKFLRAAEILKIKEIGQGVTGSKKATLSNGRITAGAHVQDVDIRKTQFETMMGVEMNFRDSWKFNIAGYRLDRLLGLRMTPVSVERKVGGHSSAVTWWIQDAMTDVERRKRRLQPPDQEEWNRQMYIVRVFDQLIYNTDRNQQNLLITKDWKVWMIDHTRAFRLHDTLREKKSLVKCERKLLARLKSLTWEEVWGATGEYLFKNEAAAILKRRDKIVRVFEDKVARQGEPSILYDYTRA